MSLISAIQTLEPGSEVLLFELDGSDYGADVLRFQGHAIPHTPEELIAAGVNADCSGQLIPDTTLSFFSA